MVKLGYLFTAGLLLMITGVSLLSVPAGVIFTGFLASACALMLRLDQIRGEKRSNPVEAE